jgi:hypothetical protein
MKFQMLLFALLVFQMGPNAEENLRLRFGKKYLTSMDQLKQEVFDRYLSNEKEPPEQRKEVPQNIYPEKKGVANNYEMKTIDSDELQREHLLSHPGYSKTKDREQQDETNISEGKTKQLQEKFKRDSYSHNRPSTNDVKPKINFDTFKPRQTNMEVQGSNTEETNILEGQTNDKLSKLQINFGSLKPKDLNKEVQEPNNDRFQTYDFQINMVYHTGDF